MWRTNSRRPKESAPASLRELRPNGCRLFPLASRSRIAGTAQGIPDLVALDFRQGLPQPVQPLELDQQYNLLLLKVVTGDGAPHFRVHEMNMTTERDRTPYTIRDRLQRDDLRGGKTGTSAFGSDHLSSRVSGGRSGSPRLCLDVVLPFETWRAGVRPRAG